MSSAPKSGPRHADKTGAKASVKAVAHRRSGEVRAGLPSIGLALGGGGARGLAHILMLEVLDELGIRPAVIAGTSIGALFGAAYAAGLTAKEIRILTESALGNRLDLLRLLIAARAEPMLKLLRFLPVRHALLNPETVLGALLPRNFPTEFHELFIPLHLVATDFYAQEAVVMTGGPLRSAMAASIALPAVFSPVMRDARVLMDGGLVNPLPFDILRGEADVIVAIDVSGASSEAGHRGHPSAFSALINASQILQRTIVREKLKAEQPDVYIDVDEVDQFGILDFHRFRQILEAAKPAQDQLRRQLTRILTSQTAETIPIAGPESAGSAKRPRGARFRTLARDPEET